MPHINLLVATQLQAHVDDCLLFGFINVVPTVRIKNNTSVDDETVTIYVTAMIDLTSLGKPTETCQLISEDNKGRPMIVGILHNSKNSTQSIITDESKTNRHRLRNCCQIINRLFYRHTKLYKHLIDLKYFLYIDNCGRNNNSYERYNLLTNRMTQCLAPNCITIVQHDPDELLQSHLLRAILSRKKNPHYPGFNMCMYDVRNQPNFPSFLSFLFESLEETYCSIKTDNDEHQFSVTALFNLNLVPLSKGHDRTLLRTYNVGKEEVSYQSNHITRNHQFVILNWLDRIRDISVRKTCTGRQINIRSTQLRHCFNTLVESINETKSSVRSNRPFETITPEYAVSSINIIMSVALDILIGSTITLLLILYIGPSDWFDMSMNHAIHVVNQVQRLLNSLMGMPVGLKLNPPLNQAMGKFFLYHIYLWKTFVTLIRPFLAVAIHALTLTGILGLSCLLSVGCDLFSLITVHIYCFYGYAARFYSLQVKGLIALWRLFRGKKWNLLRHRVDSHCYGSDQLFVGTISFTIIFFLIPTVLTYYLVFFTLHLVTRVLQDTFEYVNYILTNLPIYTTILWLSNSKKIASQIRLSPVTTCEGNDDLKPTSTCIQLKSCIESMKKTFSINSQLHSYQRQVQQFGNKLFIFRLLQGHSQLDDILSFNCLRNKLLLGEIF